jgi:Leucine-rich repeat (LRR) protein
MTLFQKRCSRLLTTAFAVCLLAIVSGCGDSEDPRLTALRDRGVRFSLNEQGQVTGLYLYGDDEHGFGDNDLEFLKDYPSVKLLLIESEKITDAGLKHIKPLKNLEELDLSLCRGEADKSGKFSGGITNAGLATLKEIPTLKRVGLQATRVTDEAVDRLQRDLPKCRIDFNYNDQVLATMRRQGLGVISTVRQMGAVVEFDDGDASKPIDLKLGITDLPLYYIGREKTLRSLTLRGAFTASGLEHLSGLPELESLDMADPYGRRNIDPAAMRTLTSLSRLSSLDLSGNQIGDTDLQMLEKLTNLKSLKVVGCPVTDRAIQRLKKSLPDCEITHSNDPLLNALLNHNGDLPAAVEAAATNAERDKDNEGKIVRVEFRLVRISDKGLAELKKLNELQSLHFVYCRSFTDEGMRNLGQMTKLKSLTISHASIGSRGVSRIAALVGLEKLDLSTNRVGSRSGQFIDDGCMRDLAALKKLTSLSLRGTEISDTGLRRLEGLTELQTLDVRRTRVTEEGLQRLKKRLPNCKVEF